MVNCEYYNEFVNTFSDFCYAKRHHPEIIKSFSEKSDDFENNIIASLKKARIF